MRNHILCLTIAALVCAGCASTGGFELFGTPLYSPTIKSRAITAENPRGEVGQGGQELGGRKGRPCLSNLEKGQVYTFAEIEGPGVIRHMWITTPRREPRMLRNLILRFYWDDQAHPSVEAPLSDFFGLCHGRAEHYESAFVTVAEGKGFNSYFVMPFAKKAKLTIANESDLDAGMFFYHVDYTLGDRVSAATPYFHAQFRRVPNTTMYEDYVILDGVKGKGRYLGACIGIVDRFAGYRVWWGEGEVKMYIDGDTEYPTICGTGSEDYAGSAWGLGQYAGRELGAPCIEDRHISFYRFHGHDPVYFNEDIKVTIQQIGNDGRFEPASEDGRLGKFVKSGEYKKDHRGGNFERIDDVCSTAYWYQTLPTQPFPPFPDKALRSLDLFAIPPGGIKGTVVDADGKPVADTEMGCRALMADGKMSTEIMGWSSARTDAAGLLVMEEALPKGVHPKVFIGYMKDRQIHVAVIENVTIVAGEIADLGTIRLKPMSFEEMRKLRESE